MSRQNFLADEPWDEIHEAQGFRSRIFERAPGRRFGATLYEFFPGATGIELHMHYGIDELFFVVSGTPVLRTAAGEEQLGPGEFVSCPEGEAGLHAFSNPAGEPARILGVSSGRLPDLLVYPERGVAWVATRDPDFPAPETGDKGIIARFDLP